MKTLLLTIKIFFAVWPDVIALVNHIKQLLPKDQHHAAVNQLIKDGKIIINKDDAASHVKEQLKTQLEIFDGE